MTKLEHTVLSLRRFKKTQSSQADGKVTGKMEAEKQKRPG